MLSVKKSTRNEHLPSAVKTSSKKKSWHNPKDKTPPKVEMPDLFCFSMDLKKKEPDSQELSQTEKFKLRVRQRQLYKKMVHEMHQLAMAHQATFIRILDKHLNDFGADMDPLQSVELWNTGTRKQEAATKVVDGHDVLCQNRYQIAERELEEKVEPEEVDTPIVALTATVDQEYQEIPALTETPGLVSGAEFTES